VAALFGRGNGKAATGVAEGSGGVRDGPVELGRVVPKTKRAAVRRLAAGRARAGVGLPDLPRRITISKKNFSLYQKRKQWYPENFHYLQSHVIIIIIKKIYIIIKLLLLHIMTKIIINDRLPNIFSKNI
jgi:hypothetical protein